MGCPNSRVVVGATNNEEEKRTMEALDLLGFNLDQTVFLVKTFDKCDKDEEGLTSYSEVLFHLGLPNITGFKYFYTRTKGNLPDRISFRNFCLNTWILLTRNQEQLVSMYFEAYDENSTGELEAKMIFRCIYDLYGSGDVDFKADELLQEVNLDKEETITKNEFMHHCHKYRSILKPLYELQKKVQERILGVAYWSKQSERAGHVLQQPEVARLFKKLPSNEYYKRERVSRLASFAIVNSYNKMKRRPSMEGNSSLAGQKSQQISKQWSTQNSQQSLRVSTVVSTPPRRRKSSMIDLTGAGGDQPRRLTSMGYAASSVSKNFGAH